MASNSAETPVISIKLGQLRGVKRTSVYDDNYYSFEGIPFAKPPLGELRFRAPLAPEPWQGVLDASAVKDKPMQKNPITGQTEGSEDCLYINVYAKTLTSAQPLPVMVWIYGGGFYMGEGSRRHQAPDYLMRKDVILVSFNYRLCSLGFLTLDDPALQVPGNAGLKDQVLALKWVKENIACFNGDANNITLFGESAGAASTQYMTVTEQTRGLFHKAILMSGSILNSWANVTRSDLAFRLAEQHGYAGENNDKLVLAYLRSLDAEKLVLHDLRTEERRLKGVLHPFVPCVEPYESADCVLPKPQVEMLKNAWGNDIPMMLGGTSFEGLLFYQSLKQSPENMLRLKAAPELMLPVEVRNAHDAATNRQMGLKILQAHFAAKDASAKDMLNFMDLYSCLYFWHGFHRTTLARLAYATKPTYLYRFAFDSVDFNFHRKKYCGKDIVAGAAHADDLSYIFYLRESYKLAAETREWKTIERMVGMWTAFAKCADPNCEEIKPLHWQPLQAAAPHMALNISNDITVMELPEKEKLETWNSLYKQLQLY